MLAFTSLTMTPLKFRDDLGLAFLQLCSHADLKDLADILTTSNGKKRFNEQLSTTREWNADKGDLPKVWHLIAAEFQRFGADSIATFIRGGKGVIYWEVLKDVCNRLKVEIHDGEALAVVENRVLLRVLESALESMSPEERAEFVKSAGETFSKGQFNPADLSAVAICAALKAVLSAGGFAAYQLAAIAANSVTKFVLGRGLSLAANAGLMRWISILGGPVGIAISTILTIPAVSGPAYRVTVPSVIYIAYLRQKLMNTELL